MGFCLEASIFGPWPFHWEAQVLFCLNTLGLVVLGVATVPFLARKIKRLEDKVEQGHKGQD